MEASAGLAWLSSPSSPSAIRSRDPDSRRDSRRIAALLQRRGKRVIPINPNATEILGEPAYRRCAICRRGREAGDHHAMCTHAFLQLGPRRAWTAA